MEKFSYTWATQQCHLNSAGSSITYSRSCALMLQSNILHLKLHPKCLSLPHPLMLVWSCTPHMPTLQRTDKSVASLCISRYKACYMLIDIGVRYCCVQRCIRLYRQIPLLLTLACVKSNRLVWFCKFVAVLDTIRPIQLVKTPMWDYIGAQLISTGECACDIFVFLFPLLKITFYNQNRL